MGFHFFDLIPILVIALLIFGPKALQSMARDAGKGVRQANEIKEKVLAELPMEEISKVTEQISRVPTNPHQVVRMLMTPEKKEQETKTDKTTTKEEAEANTASKENI